MIVKILLEGGADVDKAEKMGVTPLLIASQEGHLRVVKCLVEEGKVDVEKATKDGATPLYKASQKGHLKVVKFFG